jgi:hypothetical protein
MANGMKTYTRCYCYDILCKIKREETHLDYKRRVLVNTPRSYLRGSALEIRSRDRYLNRGFMVIPSSF